MNTQIIHDIMLSQGWKEVHYPFHGWQRHSADGKERFFTTQHPIPDTLDAAVGVIEGAGYQVYFIARDDEAMRIEAESASGIVRITHRYSSERGEHPLKPAMFELALACVKAQRKEGE